MEQLQWPPKPPSRSRGLFVSCHERRRRRRQRRGAPDAASKIFVLLVIFSLSARAAPQGGGDTETPTQPSSLADESLTLRQHAIAGAVARCVAQTAVHPLNVAKTVLQTRDGERKMRDALSSARNMRIAFSRGVGAQALLSAPNGAINFWAMELSRRFFVTLTQNVNGENGNDDAFRFRPPAPAIDLISASFGTALGTLVSLPQSVLNDRIMSGAYRNLNHAVREIGLRGLYPPSTWRAALLSKVPSYALNWACYQELRRRLLEKTGADTTTPLEDVVIGALASSVSVCVMIPLDTIKVRMTTMGAAVVGANNPIVYAGVADAVVRIVREEGWLALYRGLPPRILSVVPMTAIQFAVYEAAKRRLPHLQKDLDAAKTSALSTLNHVSDSLSRKVDLVSTASLGFVASCSKTTVPYASSPPSSCSSCSPLQQQQQQQQQNPLPFLLFLRGAPLSTTTTIKSSS